MKQSRASGPRRLPKYLDHAFASRERSRTSRQDAAPAAAAAVPAPEKFSLSGLLGPTTLSGFVDTYYSYNSNQPANRINQYQNFESTPAVWFKHDRTGPPTRRPTPPPAGWDITSRSASARQ